LLGSSRVHAFGFGSGADTNLILGAAKSGKGLHYIIDNLHEIEGKIVDALENSFFKMITFDKIKVYD